MSHEILFTNARLVLPDQVATGSLRVVDGRIDAINPGDSGSAGSASAADSLAGDYLIPGLIDLHTDNLERQAQPRATARWPSRSAYLAHDAQCAAAGVTTVFDALCAGDLGAEQGRVQTCRDGVADGAALAALDVLKAEHFLHLRCELPAPDMAALFAEAVHDPRLRMVSLIDHTPGVGQYWDLDLHCRQRAAEGMTAPEIAAQLATLQANRAAWRGPNRAAVLEAIAGREIILASHDDRTEQDVSEHHALGIRVSEFPVSLAAARAAKALGMAVIAGAPNLVRGGSHSGNVAVADLLAEGLVDALASDYVPASLIEAAFATPDIAAGVARVTSSPARIAQLADRGRLHPGLRADLVQVHLPPGLPHVPVIRRVWREGRRII